MEQESDRINFYKEYEEYGEFSNYFGAPITIDGKEYATTEHYYQSMKFYPNEAEVFPSLLFF